MHIEKIVSIEPFGVDETYDLEVDHSDHTFYANDISCSNSHAISYAIVSFQSAFLLQKYEPFWLCSYVESCLGNPDDRLRALSEIRAYGYSIMPVDINTSGKKWKILENKQFAPSFLTIKGIGLTAINEIEANRPYKDIYDFLWNATGEWKHSKVSKKTIEALIKSEAFSSFDCIGEGKPFSSYRHMHHVIVENMELIKKSLKKDPLIGRKAFDELLISTRNMPDWTQKEKIENRKEVLGYFDVSLVINEKLLEKFQKFEIKSIDNFEEGEDKKVVWMVVDSVEKKISKKGKPYFLISAMGSSGKQNKIYCWNVNDNTNILDYSVLVAEVSKNDFGLSTSMFKIRTI